MRDLRCTPEGLMHTAGPSGPSAPPDPDGGRRVTYCGWCGATLDDRTSPARGRVRCSACGAATSDPWPTPEELASAYGAWYRPQSGRRFAFMGDALLRRTRGLLARRLDHIAPPGPVLDVGAGDGVLLDALHQRGRDAVGLEREPLRPDLRDIPLEEVAGEWAAVVFWHSLEHLPEPGAAIAEAARLLPADGVIIIAVPDIDSLQARVFGDRWLHLDPPRHLVHFSTHALTFGLARVGFTVERISRVRGGQVVIGWLDGLVGSLPGDLRLYQALRQPGARSGPLAAWRGGLGLRRGPAPRGRRPRRSRGGAGAVGRRLHRGAPA
jgi:SAM-dependent methyltransferase